MLSPPTLYDRRRVASSCTLHVHRDRLVRRRSDGLSDNVGRFGRLNRSRLRRDRMRLVASFVRKHIAVAIESDGRRLRRLLIEADGARQVGRRLVGCRDGRDGADGRRRRLRHLVASEDIGRRCSASQLGTVRSSDRRERRCSRRTQGPRQISAAPSNAAGAAVAVLFAMIAG